MHQRVNADGAQGIQVHVLDGRRRRFDDHLVLVVMLQAKGVVAIASVGGPATGLDVGRTPRLGPHGTQKRRRMKGARAHFAIVRLQNHAAAFGPERLQPQYQFLEGRGDRPAFTTHAHNHGKK